MMIHSTEQCPPNIYKRLFMKQWTPEFFHHIPRRKLMSWLQRSRSAQTCVSKLWNKTAICRTDMVEKSGKPDDPKNFVTAAPFRAW